MSLYESFLQHIRQHSLFEGQQRVLLAVSGGVDSMVMTHLFSRMTIPLALTHCNFKLRPGDAERDQQLVEQVAHEMKLPFFTREFDTRAYSQSHGISIQMAARELRYGWLEELRQSLDFHLIATAHHLDDSIETLLINLSRGTGLRGLKGIPVKQGNIIRPLLFASRKEIEEYAHEHNIQYRHDLSNLQDKYQRNKIRLHIIPMLLQMNPSLHQTMQDFFENMQSAEAIFSEAINTARSSCLMQQGPDIRISLQALLAYQNPAVYLYEFLKPLGFSASICRQVASHLTSQPGKRFHSATHELLRDRDYLLVFPRQKSFLENSPCEIQEQEVVAECGEQQFRISHFPLQQPLQWPENEKTALLDHQKLAFPLKLRPWQPGDYIVPLGMKGKKKISDLLTDHKIPMNHKSKIMVLESDGKIAWVAGIRVSNLFRITKNTKKVFSISMH